MPNLFHALRHNPLEPDCPSTVSFLPLPIIFEVCTVTASEDADMEDIAAWIVGWYPTHIPTKFWIGTVDERLSRPYNNVDTWSRWSSQNLLRSVSAFCVASRATSDERTAFCPSGRNDASAALINPLNSPSKVLERVWPTQSISVIR